MTLRKLAKVLVFILLSVIIVTSSSRLLPIVAGVNWTVATHWPTRVLDRGQTVSVKVIVRMDVVDQLTRGEFSPTAHLRVKEIEVKIWDNVLGYPARVSTNFDRHIELIGEFILPMKIDSNAKSGHYQFETKVISTVDEQTSVFRDSGTIWIRGEEIQVEPHASVLSPGLAATFPAVAEEGQTITGKIYISPDPIAMTLGSNFTLVASELTIKPLGVSKELVPAGMSFNSYKAFKVPVKIPLDSEPGSHSWTVSITTIGRAWGTEVTRTVSVSGSLMVKERAPSEDELDCIIATAAFGSRMDANVEAMRHLRDDSVKITFTGGNFMRVFNNWYYSWSPSVAELVRSNEALRQFTRLILYPVVSSVIAAEGTYSLLSFDKELAATSSILTAAFICGVFYIPPLILVIRLIGGRLGRIKSLSIVKRRNSMLLGCGILSGLFTIIGGITNTAILNTVGVTVLALTVTLSAAVLTVKALTKINHLSARI